MIHLSEISANRKSSTILVLSANPAFVQCFSELGPMWKDSVVSIENSNFQSLNNDSLDLVFKYDVVVFDADPEDVPECNAIEARLRNRKGLTLFIALTDSNLSIAKARHLADIGIDEVLPIDITPEALKKVIDHTLEIHHAPVHLIEAPKEATELAQVIAVTQARGGIGATTVAVNLACSLARKGSMFRKQERKRVALLDFDLQFGNANVFLDIEDNGGFLRMIASEEMPDARYLAGIMHKHELGIDVLCAPATVAPLQSVSVEMVTEILALLQREYDYIIVDMPRALVDWIEPVVRTASQLLIITDTSVPCVRQARRLLNFFRSERDHLKVDIVVNHEKKPFLKSDHVREAERVLGVRLSHWLPDNPRVARKSVDLGRPVIATHGGSDLGKALTRMSSTFLMDSKTLTKKARSGMTKNV
ncbi:AAA family ATPase [Puniceibacterium confluentis]|uniref:AAA family ATPase n=1 Tax=Puniceibacterium confluentis TaxID=1958944 RepID=UPI0011B6FB15|nr:AAA family ATPase [Puniceibacterium confluentis]